MHFPWPISDALYRFVRLAPTRTLYGGRLAQMQLTTEGNRHLFAGVHTGDTGMPFLAVKCAGQGSGYQKKRPRRYAAGKA